MIDTNVPGTGSSISSKPVLKSSSSESDSAPPRRLRFTKCPTSRTNGLSAAFFRAHALHLFQADFMLHSSPEESPARFSPCPPHPPGARRYFPTKPFLWTRAAAPVRHTRSLAPSAVPPAVRTLFPPLP